MLNEGFEPEIQMTSIVVSESHIKTNMVLYVVLCLLNGLKGTNPNVKQTINVELYCMVASFIP